MGGHRLKRQSETLDKSWSVEVKRATNIPRLQHSTKARQAPLRGVQQALTVHTDAACLIFFVFIVLRLAAMGAETQRRLHEARVQVVLRGPHRSH